MTNLESFIKRAKELCDNATEGPWFIDGSEVRFDCSPTTTNSGIEDCTIQICDVGRISETLDHKAFNREFIAASRDMVPKLVEALEEARAALEHYVGESSLKYPSDWNCFKQGGPPDIGDYDPVDIGCIAEQALLQIERILGDGK